MAIIEGLTSTGVEVPVKVGADGTLQVSGGTSGGTAGDVASGATDSGNPVKVGGVYNTTLPTFTNGQRANFQVGTAGSLNVTVYGANSASAVSVGSWTDANTSGNLFRVGAYCSVWNGTTTDRQYSGAASAAAGGGIGAIAVEESGRLFTNISTATTTTVKSGKGNLHCININTGVASATITIYDSTTATGTKIGTLTLPSTVGQPFNLFYDLAFTNGLTIVTSGATDLTVVYR